MYADSFRFYHPAGNHRSRFGFCTGAERAEANCAYIGQWTREQHAAAITDEDALHLIIEDDSGKQAGYIIATGLQDPNLTVNLKRIVVDSKGQGYGKLTLRLLTDWIFRHTATHRLWLDVKDHNSRARHVYEGAGYIYEGTLRDCIKKGELFESLQVMSILRPEYYRALHD